MTHKRRFYRENDQVDLSIVIPAFQESSKVGRDIEAASEFLAGNDFAGEIIVVDDGSTDGTSDAAKKASRRISQSNNLRAA